jgi:hypothetical protein
VIIIGNLQRNQRRVLQCATDKAIAKWASFPLPGNCFFNAQALTLEDRSRAIQYHEGYITCHCGLCGEDDEKRIPHAFNTIDGVFVDSSLRIPHPRTYDIVHTFSPERIQDRRRQCEKEGHTRIIIGSLPGQYGTWERIDTGAKELEFRIGKIVNIPFQVK